MKILISGSSGLIGQRLRAALHADGHQVLRLMRSRERGGIYWDPQHGVLDASAIEGVDAVINLSGENVAAGRWTEARKDNICRSRLDAANTLVTAMKQMKIPPKLFLCASAVGFYGDRGDELCDEDTPPGRGFLAKVCVDWETAATQAANVGIRTVILRFGVVLAPEGGALGKMLLPFKLCLGGVIGSGRQYMSWVAIDDVVDIIKYLFKHEDVEGVINVVAPEAATNAAFTKTLSRVLGRVNVLPFPAFALRLLLGKEMADETLLSSTRCVPAKLEKAGFQFKYGNLEKALNHLYRNRFKIWEFDKEAP